MKLVMSLRDKYAAMTISAALLGDRLQEVELLPGDRDRLEYLLDVILELQTEFGTQLQALQEGNKE